MTNNLSQFPPEKQKEIFAGGGTPQQKTPRKTSNKGSKITLVYGQRKINSYPITEAELRNLFALGLWAAFFFTVFTSLLSFAFGIYKDISFASSVPKEGLDFWKDVETYCFLGSVVSCIIMIVFFRIGDHKIGQIKKNTKFDE